MSTDHEHEFAEFMADIKNISDPPSPQVDLCGKTVTHKPYAAITCKIEQAPGDENTVLRNPRILLYIDHQEEDDGIYIDLTMEESLQSMHLLFKDDVIPVELLICQPNQTCIEAIIAHFVAKKISYTVSVEELRYNNQVRFRIKLGYGSALEAVVDRDKVAKYFQWEPLTLIETV